MKAFHLHVLEKLDRIPLNTHFLLVFGPYFGPPGEVFGHWCHHWAIDWVKVGDSPVLCSFHISYLDLLGMKTHVAFQPEICFQLSIKITTVFLDCFRKDFMSWTGRTWKTWFKPLRCLLRHRSMSIWSFQKPYPWPIGSSVRLPSCFCADIFTQASWAKERLQVQVLDVSKNWHTGRTRFFWKSLQAVAVISGHLVEILRYSNRTNQVPYMALQTTNNCWLHQGTTQIHGFVGMLVMLVPFECYCQGSKTSILWVSWSSSRTRLCVTLQLFLGSALRNASVTARGGCFMCPCRFYLFLFADCSNVFSILRLMLPHILD